MILIALFTLPSNIYAEDFIAVDKKAGKKILVELQYYKEYEINTESAIFALQSSLYQSELALNNCEEGYVLGKGIDKLGEDVIKTFKEKSEMFEKKNTKCQKDLVKYKKYKPWYKNWYFYSNAGWLLLFLL